MALMGAMATALVGIIANLVGIRTGDRRWLEVGRRTVLAVCGLVSVAAMSLFYLLITSDFRYAYVVNYTTRGLELIYKIGAFWGGNAGSLLLWVWVLSILAAVAVSTRHPESDRMHPWVAVFLLLIAAFFLLMLLFVSQPFERLPAPATEGKGLNPLLQNPGMLLHPVYLYLGFVGFSVPYAYAMAALLTRSASDIWLKVTRRWTLLAWLFLTMGILYGGQWAYVELGWGGYWAWDPVENASLLPWLTGTAFLHSAVVQEQKGMLKGWNIGLIIATFLLTIFGTFLTRSGVVISVHAFANGPLGAFFLSFIGLMTVVSVYIVADRWELLRARHDIESLVSREASFLVNNLLLVGAAFAVIWGTMLPVISELVSGIKVGVGPLFFNQVNVPIGIALILLMGVGPLLPWRRASQGALLRSFAYPLCIGVLTALVLELVGVTKLVALIGFGAAAFVIATIIQEFVRGALARQEVTGEPLPLAVWNLACRNRRRYGGYLVHLAIILMVIGFTGSGAYRQETTVTLEPNQTLTFSGYELTHEGVWIETKGDRTEVFARLAVEKDGRVLGVLRPEKVFFTYNSQPTTEVAIRGSLAEDLYVALGSWEDSGMATYQIYVNPLVAWIWIGQYLLLGGTLFAMWPEANRGAVTTRLQRQGTGEMVAATWTEG